MYIIVQHLLKLKHRNCLCVEIIKMTLLWIWPHILPIIHIQSNANLNHPLSYKNTISLTHNFALVSNIFLLYTVFQHLKFRMHFY